MMLATSITALLIALVPRVALGSNLRSKTDVHVTQYATSVSPPIIGTTRRLDRSDDHSDDSADGNITEGSYAYVGCFSDNMDSTVMEDGYVCGGTTVETCFSHCTESGASFMGLKHGYVCSCGFGEEYEYTLNGAGTCETECSGDGSSICGGEDAFSLYSLGESSSEPVEPMSPSPVTSTGLPSTGVPLTTASPTTTYTSGPSSSPTSSSDTRGNHGRRTRPPASSRPPAPSRSATRMPAATMPPPSSSPVASPTPSPVVSFNPDPTTPSVTPETPSPVSPETPSSPVTPETEPTPSPVAPVSPPTQPSPESSTPADMELLLQLHNEARCIHNADPLTWSDAVASSAALHAQTLAGECGEFYHSESEDRNGYGENLFTCWGSDTCYSAVGAMQGLYNDEVDDISEVTEYGGHATQILWKSTEELGCAVSTCTDDDGPHTYLVCQYDPPGNYDGSYEEEVGLLTDDGSC